MKIARKNGEGTELLQNEIRDGWIGVLEVESDEGIATSVKLSVEIKL